MPNFVHTREAFTRALELPQWPAGPLHQAAYRGNLDRVRSLVEAGADVTARDERFDATALDWAGWTKQDAIVAYLKISHEGGRSQWGLMACPHDRRPPP
jgi:hypothetical protein